MESKVLLGPVHMGSQVPLTLASPNMEAKSQVLSLKKPLKLDLDSFMKKNLWDLCSKLGNLGLAFGST